MAKPIFLIKLNQNIPPDHGQKVQEKIRATIGEEYHVLVACILPTGNVEFECFNPDNLPAEVKDKAKIAYEGDILNDGDFLNEGKARK